MDCWFTITAFLPKLVDLPWWSSLVLLQRFLPKIDPLASSPAGSAVESCFGRERYDGWSKFRGPVLLLHSFPESEVWYCSGGAGGTGGVTGGFTGKNNLGCTLAPCVHGWLRPNVARG